MEINILRCFFLIFGIISFGVVLISANEESIAVNDFSNKPAESGVRIVARADWGAQQATDSPRRLKVQPATYAIISHTATQSCYNEAKCKLNVRVIQTFHIEAKGWVDVGYNFLVGGDGNVYEGRGWDMAGAHTHNYNNRSIGIAFVGDFSYKSPPKEQIATAVKLLELGVKKNKLSKDYKLIGQRQVAHTQSPGDKLFNVIRTWEHWTSNP